jgi:selenium-binding protein 1
MVLELRPAHDPNETYGFVGVVTSLKDLSASVWMWHREGSSRSGTWRIHKVIEIPAEPTAADDLPPIFKGFGAALRSSPISTSRSTIDSSMSLALAQAS